MATGTLTPWEGGGGHTITQAFYDTNNQLKKLILENHFDLSQFADSGALENVDQLTWRHYIVYWSSVFALKNTQSARINYVECGVCDGLTTYFALSAAKTLNKPFKAYLYDAWDSWKEDSLLKSDQSIARDYAFLNMEATKRNLNLFGTDVITFNRGYIPDVFQVANNPETLIWLHIDLNSAKPTIHALKYFWDKLEDGGVVLFDDYAWSGHQETKKAVEDWSADRNGTLFHLPTGQALVIKNRTKEL